METYTQAREKDKTNTEIMGRKRQEKALREFKQVLEDLLYLLRSASEMETVYMYWINRSREQFVMETKATTLTNVMFQDRVGFREHFLNDFKEISEPVGLKVGNDIAVEDLGHYYNDAPVQYITLLPFINNGETVAITVMESSDHILTDQKSEIIFSYINALRNVLNTYLEISDLYEQQEEWIDYEESLNSLNAGNHRSEIVIEMINKLQEMLHNGGVSFIVRDMDTWCNVANSRDAKNPPPVGMPVEERTLAYEALQKGEPEFAIHFNNNPKRISPREYHTEGATLAIPLLMKDRRQGVVLVYDDNPLIFKESSKHKFINLVRTSGLQIMANDNNLDVDENFLTNEYEALIPDIWEKVVDTELDRLRDDHIKTVYHSWLGLITLADLPGLRTQLRLEDLQQMQRDMVRQFNPSRFGVPGVIGYNSDYVYAFLVQSRDEKAVENWTRSLKQEFKEPMTLGNGKEIKTGIKVGFTKLDPGQKDFYQALSHAKSALSKAVKGSGSS